MAARNVILPLSVQGKTLYRAADFKEAPQNSKFMDMAQRARSAIEDAGFNLLKLSDLETKLGASSVDIKKVVVYLREQDDLRTIEGGLLFARSVRDRLLKVLADIDSGSTSGITVGALRDAIGVNRKDSLAMLDFFDTQGKTRRDGDRRILSK